MHIEFSEEAKAKLEQLMDKNEASMLRLAYDTDDCGCGVNGVPVIRLENDELQTDIRVANDNYTIVMNKEQSVFFKENMKVEVHKGAFRLKSDEGILNPVISTKQVCEKEEIS